MAPKCIGKSFYVRVNENLPESALRSYGLARGQFVKVRRYNIKGEYASLCDSYFNLTPCNENDVFFLKESSYIRGSLTIPQDYCEFTNDVSVTKLMKEEEGWF